MRSKGGSTVCRTGAIRYLGAALAFVLGTGMLVLVALLGRRYFVPWITIPLCTAFGAFVLWCAFASVRNKNLLAWTPGTDTVRLSRDNGWTVRDFEFSKNDVQPRLRIADRDVDRVDFGTSILALVPVAHPECEIIIARNQTGGAIQPLYDRLNEFFGGTAKDETLSPITLPDGDSRKVSRLPISNASASFSTMTLRFPTSDKAEFRPSWHARFIYGVFLALGLMGVAMGVFSLVKNEWSATVMCFLVGGAFAAFGWWAPRGGFSSHVVADRLRGTLTFESLRKPASFPLKDILAVQLCSRYVTGEDAYTTYEINLVIDDAQTTRKNILSNATEKRVRADARRFAEFLQKPLLDHV